MSQARRTSETPDRASSHPAVSRRLDFSEHTEVSAAQSPLKTATRRGGKRTARGNVYDISATPPPAHTREQEEDIPEEEEEEEQEDRDGNYELDVQITEEYDPQYANNDSLQLLDDEAIDSGLGALNEDLEPLQTSSPTNLRKAKRRTRSSVEIAPEIELTEEESNPANSKAAGRSGPQKRGQKGKGKLLVTKPSQTVLDESTVMEEGSALEEPIEVSEVEPVPTKKRRGRPKKAIDESEIVEEPTVAEEPTMVEEPEIPVPKKRGRPRKDASIVEEDARPAKRTKTANKGPLTKKNSNAKMGPPKVKVPAARYFEGSPTKRTSPSTWAGNRAVSRLREGTPAADVAATRSRYGRTVLKPLQHWAGERASYDRDGTIKEVQLSESVDLPKRKGVSGLGRKKRIRNTHDLDDIEEQEEDGYEDPEEWEIRCERIAARVKDWDSARGVINEDDEYELGMCLCT
jgi:centromere protein C